MEFRSSSTKPARPARGQGGGVAHAAVPGPSRGPESPPGGGRPRLPRDPRAGRDPHDPHDPYDPHEPRAAREGREGRDGRDGREARDGRAAAREQRSGRESGQREPGREAGREPGRGGGGNGGPHGTGGGGGPRGPQRLTAIGTGVLTLAATFLGGLLDSVLFGDSGWLLGLAYLAVSFQAAIRVRPADLAAAPISGPICFAATLLLVGPGSGSGLTGQAVDLATSLAMDAGWLFAGTSVSVLIVLARHFALARTARR